MKDEAYRWTGRVQDSHTLRVHQVMEVEPGTEVDLVAVPRGSTTSEEQHQARYRAWKEFQAMPVNEEDRRFWEKLERQVYEARKATRWRETEL